MNREDNVGIDEQQNESTQSALYYLPDHEVFALVHGDSTRYYRLIEVWNLGVSEQDIGRALVKPYDVIELKR